MGLALDAKGEPTTDPKTALEAMSLLPLGSGPETGSYKGFGLALAIDVLSGILSGGSFGRHVGGSGSHRDVADVSHFFLAIRVKAFSPWVKFRNRLQDMTRQITGVKAKGAPRVYYPGEAEYAIEQERRATGIPIDRDVASELEGLARRFDILDAWEHVVEGKK